MSTSVAAHLNIRLSEYDARIRTFIPGYDEMLDAVASCVQHAGRTVTTIVDLGIGNGALTARILARHEEVHVIGIDGDAGMIDEAKERLRSSRSVKFLMGDFVTIEIPRSDAFVATLALHHIREEKEKCAFYSRCFQALPKRGVLVNGDYMPSRSVDEAERQRQEWVAHLRRSYSTEEADGYLLSWSKEDTYFPIEDECEWMREAGFDVRVEWRNGGFAVVKAEKIGW